MAERFRVGQKVRIIRTEKHTAKYRDMVVTIKAKVGYVSDRFEDDMCYDIGLEVYGEDRALEPVYDGDQKSSWSESAWKPQTEPMRPVAETK